MKKHDIKFKIPATDKQKLMLMAMDEDQSLTAFCSKLVRTELVRYREYEGIPYPEQGLMVHVKLEEDYFKMVQTLSAQWLLSYRKVIHRLITNYLKEPNPSDAMIISYHDL
ncbi:hypothetical protein NOM01_10900 [Sporolactobacillus sp. STSJ-5]|uniref:hypothetical protein n=1 Tax=Sporolactobacillus sp. STSJ-5 TaxID=2965076 RepID=UPI00210697CF|nr:hypothetical protein [Sporolactobacillus sp. STSJ-5]MCQ2010523.1 hypothetical protein [Sporolactobacillus sp. STSJ-5]